MTETSRRERRDAIEGCLENLRHAVHCHDNGCTLPRCSKMKRVVAHTRQCRQSKRENPCAICKQLVALCCYHAKNCQSARCNMPFCGQIKRKLEAQELVSLYSRPRAV
ncbi:CBP-like protein [Mya arenaria]|uniref:histone acetyltransferase n=1 Tax=Mya arenaria TaxID=6604 RepID=A0ABY7GED3_MYAAR|nr:CBP-like protein [Mya arenaria]